MNFYRRLAAVVLLVAVLSSCAAFKPQKLRRMPAPAVMNNEQYNPFTDGGFLDNREQLPLLYVTNRIPETDSGKRPYYKSQRAEALRAGVATVEISSRRLDWEDQTFFNSDEDGKDNFRPKMRMTNVEDFGALDNTVTIFSTLQKDEVPSPYPRERFLSEIRSRLAKSGTGDVYIFVHGYNVNFANPILMSAELWHYMGYRGAFICFAWPASPNNTAYMRDLYATTQSTRSFRILLDFLEEQEDIKKIHILGYSMGTGMTIQTLYEKKLASGDMPPEEVRRRGKIGNVVLANSDMDRGLFGTYLLEGLADLTDRITLYTSSKDIVLKGADVIHGEPRMGQYMKEKQWDPAIREFYENNDKLDLVEVSNAPNITATGGHFYLTQSPWVSSDAILSLTTDLTPEERGLMPQESLPGWYFPDDYVERCRSLLPQLPFSRK